MWWSHQEQLVCCCMDSWKLSPNWTAAWCNNSSLCETHHVLDANPPTQCWSCLIGFEADRHLLTTASVKWRKQIVKQTSLIQLTWIEYTISKKKFLILLGEFETARPLRFFPTDFRNPGWGFRRTHDGRGRTTVASARLWTPLNFFKNNRSQTKIVNEMQREILLATLAQRTTKR